MKEDEIKRIAYNLWEEENCPNDKEWEHWFRAEAIWEEHQKIKGVTLNTETKVATLEPSNLKSKRKRRTMIGVVK
jgi:hypothetical protein